MGDLGHHPAASTRLYYVQGYLASWNSDAGTTQDVVDGLQKILDQKRAERKAVGMETEDDKEQDEAEKKARIIKKTLDLLQDQNN